MKPAAPSSRTWASLAAAATAKIWALRILQSWISAEPTPPEAPVTSTVSPSRIPARTSMFSAVE